MFVHQLCFLCYFRWCCWTPAQQQPAVQIQLHHWGAAGQDQGVKRGQCRLQDLQWCARQPCVERSQQQGWPTNSAGGTSLQRRKSTCFSFLCCQGSKIRAEMNELIITLSYLERSQMCSSNLHPLDLWRRTSCTDPQLKVFWGRPN